MTTTTTPTRRVTISDWRRRPEALAEAWENRAACYNRPEEWWDGDTPAATEKARAVCLSCPVLAECLGEQMRNERSQLWSRTLIRGGLTGPERIQLCLDERADGAYDAEEARLLALEAGAYGEPIADIAEDGVSASTLRLAARLAGEAVEKRTPAAVDSARPGTAIERAFQKAEDILQWRDAGLTMKQIADALNLTRDVVQKVVHAYRDMGGERQAKDPNQYVIDAYLAGDPVSVEPEQQLAAIAAGVTRGMSYLQIDRVRGIPKDSTSQFVSRMRKRYSKQGREFPVKQPSRNLFTDQQVLEMRELYARGGITDLEIALRYGAPRNAVSHALSGRNYKHVGGPIRAGRQAESVKASRMEFCGHTEATAPVPLDSSRQITDNEMGAAA